MTGAQGRMLERIKRHEGYRRHVYRCPAGKLTVGYGTNVEDGFGIPERIASDLVTAAVDEIIAELSDFHWFGSLSPVRQFVIVEMAYQMGVGGVLGFVNMISAIVRGQFSEAALEMLDSRWSRKTPGRANLLARIMETGVDPGADDGERSEVSNAV